MATLPDADASDATSSASESSVAPPPAKKRKATYYLRKDEIKTLQDQIKSLQHKLQQLEDAPPPSPPRSLDPRALHAALGAGVAQNNLTLAGAQSALSAYNLAINFSPAAVPLKTYVHLPGDAAARNEILSGLHEPKLRAAVHFMAERTRCLDLRVAHRQAEHFDLPSGEVVVTSLEVAQFRDGHSLRQVYDALMFFVTNQEISVSENLGILTIRETDEIDEFKFCQSKFLSTIPEGLEVESNGLIFATCVDATDDSPGYAVGAMDFVDLDDLHPYRPDECARKEVVGAVTLNEIPSPTGGPPLVAMCRWSYVRFYPPSFPLSKQVEDAARASMLQWCELIPRVMKERLATQPVA